MRIASACSKVIRLLTLPPGRARLYSAISTKPSAFSPLANGDGWGGSDPDSRFDGKWRLLRLIAEMGVAMWDLLLRLLPVGCSHRHTSLPFSESSSSRKASHATEWDAITPSQTGIYVVCLDCGRHFDYDWATMKVIR